MNLRRLSFLVTTTLCAFTFLFSTASAPADPKKEKVVGALLTAGAGAVASALSAPKKEKVVGTVKTEGGSSIRINGKTAGSGASVSCGDVLETTDSAKVALASGQEYVIDPGSKVKLTCSPDGKVALLVIYGGIHPVGGTADYLDPLPWLAAFANGNSSFPSIGGGKTVSTVLPTGQVIFTNN